VNLAFGEPGPAGSARTRQHSAELVKPGPPDSAGTPAHSRWLTEATENPVLRGQPAASRTAERAQIGGSARGYQPGFVLSANQKTADVRVADPYMERYSKPWFSRKSYT
jgi:hypothetical protein